MKLKLKKLFTTLLIVQIFFVNLVPVARAEEGTVTENSVTVESNATPTPAVESTVNASSEQTVSETPSPTPTLTPEQQEEADERAALLERRARSQAAAESFLEDGDINRVVSQTSATMLGIDTTADDKIGDSTITTGDATNTAVAVNTGNNNLAGSAGISSDPAGAQVATSGNGPYSNNSGALAINNDSATVQDNNAKVNTGLNQSATTGNNNNSENVGGTSSIDTGNANVTGTVINAVNTNVDGVMVSEFNVADNHTGDIVLDFAAGCISGCGSGSTAVSNTGNGSYSDNNATVDTTNTNDTTQINNAALNSELVLVADSGNNTADANVGGDSNITTGDANVEANAITFANNNIAGDVVYAVVNIFGNLVGDIILPESAIASCCGTGDLTAANTGNGSNSDNNASINVDNNDSVFQTNDISLGNDLVLDAQTGKNSTNNNTGGDSSITTGSTDVQANVLNIVNSNLVGGTMWLVLINEAGNWIGKLIGAPDGSNMAASAGTEFAIDANGYITATNNGNGPSSDNNATVSQANNNTITQTNIAKVQNTLDLSANTGGNNANDNVGGNSNITTGDAKIIANIVNFVNNNIAGKGKLVVTVVNVFGSWLGDFVAPGQQKQNHNQTSTTETGSTSTNSNNTSNSSSSNSSSQGLVAGVQQTLHLTQKGDGDQNGTVSLTHGTSTTVAVAGISTTNSSNKMIAGNSKKKIKINLAWLLFLIPLAGAVIIGRKVVYAKFITKKN